MDKSWIVRLDNWSVALAWTRRIRQPSPLHDLAVPDHERGAGQVAGARAAVAAGAIGEPEGRGDEAARAGAPAPAFPRRAASY